MSIPNAYLPFNIGNIQQVDTRVRPSKYAQSNLRNWRFEQSEGIRPAEYMGVYKFLPVAFQDVNTEDWVVIPKGRIVSSIGPFESATTISGLVHPASSGSIPIANSGDYMGTGTGGLIRASIDNSYFGYDEHICGLMVPANGGSGTFNYFYSADDVTANTRIASGGRASASGAYAQAANIPIGVAFSDVYQDIRGEYLNYRMHPDGQHFLTDWYVEVPFVDYRSTGAANAYNPSPSNSNNPNYGMWRIINKQFTYLSFDSTSDTVHPGAFVCPDGIGNYKMQGAPTFTVAGNSGTVTMVGGAYNYAKTAQTVGKLIALDTRMPKDMLEDVLTYPRSGMPGSQTAGMIKNLFDFAYYVLATGSGSAPTVDAIWTAIRQGVFGLARIQLLVS
jgi:hypothetical protein